MLRIDEVHIEGARVAEGLLNGGFRDLVEDDAGRLFDGNARRLADVPGDGFAFAVGVCGEKDAIGGQGRLCDLVDDAGLIDATGLVLHDHVLGPEVFEVFDAIAVRREVADVAHGGDHAVVITEDVFHGAGLRGRFNDHEVAGARTRTAAGWRCGGGSGSPGGARFGCRSFGGGCWHLS